jgi:hypothetical protein
MEKNIDLPPDKKESTHQLVQKKGGKYDTQWGGKDLIFQLETEERITRVIFL